MLLMQRKIASVAIPMAPLQMKCARREYSVGDEVVAHEHKAQQRAEDQQNGDDDVDRFFHVSSPSASDAHCS